jgi:hypothetical protein
MAKSLQHPPPSSTVARLLDAGAAARAIDPPRGPAQATPADHGPTSDSPRRAVQMNEREPPIKRELTLSLGSDDTFTELIDLYRRATGARLSASHIIRAVLVGIAPCLPALQREANRIGRWRLPSNAPGYEEQRQQLEHRIGQAFIAGVRAAWNL